MGVVYKAVDTSLDRLVAVKVLNSDDTLQSGAGGAVSDGGAGRKPI